MKKKILQELLLKIRVIGKKVSLSQKKIGHYKKGPHDFATSADYMVEDEIFKFLKKITPGIPILSEEDAFSQDITEWEKRDFFWVLDPLDGTHNFMCGSSHYTISLGLIEKNECTLGVTYAPEWDTFYVAFKEGGAFIINGENKRKKKVTLSHGVIHPRDGLISLGSFEKTDKESGELLKKCSQSFLGFRKWGCSTLEIINVGLGKLRLYYSSRYYPWDVAASGLFASESGAKIVAPTGKFSLFHGKILVGDSKAIQYFRRKFN